jgi:hypothetical protein
MTQVEQPDLQAALATDYTPTFLLRTEGRIAGLSALLRKYVRANGVPGAVVANVGTEDALQATVSTTSGRLLQPLLTAASSTPCVVLTTVSLRADHAGGSVAARINHEITLLAQSDPTRYKVVDWNHFLATLPAPSVPTYLQSDRIIETAAGAAWLARSDDAGVRECGSIHQPTVIGSNPG